MLGGGFVNLLSNSVESAYTALRYPVVAALSTFVIALLAVLLVILMLVARRFGDLSSTFRVLKSLSDGASTRITSDRRPSCARSGGDWRYWSRLAAARQVGRLPADRPDLFPAPLARADVDQRAAAVRHPLPAVPRALRGAARRIRAGSPPFGASLVMALIVGLICTVVATARRPRDPAHARRRAASSCSRCCRCSCRACRWARRCSSSCARSSASSSASGRSSSATSSGRCPSRC